MPLDYLIVYQMQTRIQNKNLTGETSYLILVSHHDKSL